MIKQAGNRIPKIKYHSKLLFILAGIILIPVGIILSSFFTSGTEIWKHILDNLLHSYLTTTILLALGVVSSSIIIGVATAWIVVTYDFPFKRILSTLLAIPIAIPAYINAFTYAGLFDYTGIVQKTFGVSPGIMNLPGAIFIMTLALYPYVYLPVRSAFRQQAGSIYEAARVMGISGFKLFFRIALPLVRPALVGGSVLALMEVLNEYGAVHYFGVNTLTVGIFRAWFSLGDLTAAMKLAGLLLISVLVIISGEKYFRRRIGYSLPASRPFKEKRVSSFQGACLSAITVLPVLFGFIIPVMQLLVWAIRAEQSIISPLILRLTGSSFLIAGSATLVILIAAVTASHLLRNRLLKGRRFLSSSMTLGYAVPGAVIAIGIMILFGRMDLWLDQLVSIITGSPGRLFLSGSLGALILAYAIRYLGVAFNPLAAGFTQISSGIHEASRTLGRTSLKSLLTVDLPNIPASLKAAGLLVFIDILKELPLTMILRPFNFDTLAVRAYEMASDERLTMAAMPSLIIVAAGILPAFILSSSRIRKGRTGK